MNSDKSAEREAWGTSETIREGHCPLCGIQDNPEEMTVTLKTVEAKTKTRRVYNFGREKGTCKNAVRRGPHI